MEAARPSETFVTYHITKRFQLNGCLNFYFIGLTRVPASSVLRGSCVYLQPSVSNVFMKSGITELHRVQGDKFMLPSYRAKISSFMDLIV